MIIFPESSISYNGFSFDLSLNSHQIIEEEEKNSSNFLNNIDCKDSLSEKWEIFWFESEDKKKT